MMEPAETQAKLNAAYDTWKAEINVSNSDVEGFSSPLLLSVTDDYCHAKTRIMFFGKETNDWSWNKNLRTDYPGYPLDWPFQDLNWFQDFLNSSEGVEGLAWAYKEFAFAQCQPRTRSKLFWQAFRDVQKGPTLALCGTIWPSVISTMATREEIGLSFGQTQKSKSSFTRRSASCSRLRWSYLIHTSAYLCLDPVTTRLSSNASLV